MKYSVLAAAVFLGGCAVLFPSRPPSDPVERLQYDIDRVLGDSLFVPARASIKVVSLDNGQGLYDRDSKLLMRPASNTKLLTSATALAVLGKNFLYKTSVLIDTLPSGGVVSGNVYLKGFGNPDLKTSDIDSLASLLAVAGIRQINGDVVADNSYFDDLSWGNGWMWDDEPDPDEMFISALSVNKNCVTVNVAPCSVEGDSAIVSVDPPTSYITLQSKVATVKDSVVIPLKISRLFRERLNTITAEGQILLGANPRKQQISVWKPELYAAQLLKESLIRHGIAVFGQTKPGTTPLFAVETASHNGRIDSVLVNLNKVSDNLSAENTLKILGASKYGIPGSARNGLYVVNSYLSTLGIDTTRFLVVDGSGVSHYNLVTVEMLVQLLMGVYRDQSIFPLFYESLPIGGIDGTIKSRMNATMAEGNLRAKTGMISGVSSLSGYVRTRDNEMLAFSIMMQNFILPTSGYRRAQDRIGELLAMFSRYRSLSAAQGLLNGKRE